MDADGRTDSIAVVGMGNLLMQDDGVGIHVLEALRQEAKDGVELIDGGTDAWAALWEARRCCHLLVLDAVRGGGEPGTVYRLDLDGVEAPGAKWSLHDVNLVHAIGLDEALGGRFETVTVLGMEPGQVEPGIGLSEPCRRALPRLVRAALSEVQKVRHTEKVPGAQPC